MRYNNATTTFEHVTINPPLEIKEIKSEKKKEKTSTTKKIDKKEKIQNFAFLKEKNNKKVIKNDTILRSVCELQKQSHTRQQI